MTQKQGQTVFLVLVLFAITTSAGVLLYRFPGSYEIIYGAIGAVLGTLSLYVSAMSYELTKSAQEDSRRSADATVKSMENAEAIMQDSKLAAQATVDSAAAAYKALELTTLQVKQASDITRIENGSHLILQKKEMHYPLLAPRSSNQGISWIDDLNEKSNLKKLRLTNTNKGEATNITLTYYLENVDEFHRLNIHADYEGREDKLNKTAIEKGLKFPVYELRYFVKNHIRRDKFIKNSYRSAIVSLDKYYVGGKKGRRKVIQNSVATKNPRNIAFLEFGDDFWFSIPESFRVLCHQYFLERGLLQETEWRRPSPVLLVRVEYNEPIYDKLGDLDAYNRVKEFEVTCSSNVKIIRKEGSEEQEPNKNYVLSCYFVIKTRLDQPISKVTAPQEELATEKDLDGRAGPTEG